MNTHSHSKGQILVVDHRLTLVFFEFINLIEAVKLAQL